MRAYVATFFAIYGLVVLSAFASDAQSAAYPGARDAATVAVRTFLAMIGPMWGLGIASARSRPSALPLGAIEIAANGQTAVVGAALFSLASCAPWATVPFETVALLLVAGALGSPTLRVSIDRAVVERFAHLSLMGRSLLIAAIVGIYAALAPLWTQEAGYVIGPIGLGAWPFTAAFAAIGNTLYVMLGGFLVGATFPKPASQPPVAAAAASASVASSKQPVSQQRPG